MLYYVCFLGFCGVDPEGAPIKGEDILATTKHRRNGKSFFFIISCVIFLFGVFFIVDPFANFMVETMVFAGGLLIIGIAFLSAYSLPSSEAQGEWPIIEGLTDVLLAIVLFMSMGTNKTDIIIYIFSVWAAAGFVSRLLSALKAPAKLKKQTLFHSGACLVAAVLMAAATTFLDLPPQPVAGVGIIIYSFGSFISPRKAFGKNRISAKHA